MAVIKRAIGIFGVSSLLLVSTACQVATFSQDARRRGLTLYEQGNYGDAAGAFRNATQQMPTDYLSYYYLAETYDKLGDNQRAIQAYKAARDTRFETMAGISDVATRNKVYLGLATAIAKGTSKDAEIEILRNRAMAARNGDDLIVLAEIFIASGDPDSALQSYAEVTKKYPTDGWYAKEYGLYLAKMGFKDRAKAMLTTAERLKPDNEVEAALKGL